MMEMIFPTENLALYLCFPPRCPPVSSNPFLYLSYRTSSFEFSQMSPVFANRLSLIRRRPFVGSFHLHFSSGSCSTDAIFSRSLKSTCHPKLRQKYQLCFSSIPQNYICCCFCIYLTLSRNYSLGLEFRFKNSYKTIIYVYCVEFKPATCN